MGRTIWLDCSAGVAGDMLVAALIDLGANEDAVRSAVRSLPLEGIEELRVTRVEKSGIGACDFDVVLDHEHETHDHDMAWLRGDDHDHHYDQDHVHAHDHDHGHHHHHAHRTLSEVLAVVDAGNLTEGARTRAHRTFEILAEAEAQAHDTTPDQVHFHEVGTVDSIVDVVAACTCLDLLGIDKVIVPMLAEGFGTIRCAHGLMPVPVPAVTAIAAAHGLALHATGIEGELVTPTGAALVAAVRTGDRLPERYVIEGTGLGAGKRDYPTSGVLRAMLIREVDGGDGDSGVWRLETDLDDCTGEALGTTLDLLMAAGAREAHYIPCFMKKNRPGWQLQVICTEAERPALERIIFENTTTIGIRRQHFDRTALPRETESAETPFGTVALKCVTLPGGVPRCYPEHRSVVALAEDSGASYQDVWRAALAACGAVEARRSEG